MRQQARQQAAEAIEYRAKKADEILHHMNSILVA